MNRQSPDTHLNHNYNHKQTWFSTSHQIYSLNPIALCHIWKGCPSACLKEAYVFYVKEKHYDIWSDF